MSLVADTLAAAFAEDRVVKWIAPVDARRLNVMRDFFQVGLERLWHPHGLVYVAHDLAGAAVWMPPGPPPISEDEMGEIGSAIAATYAEFTESIGGLVSKMEELHPREPHYHLPFIGVRPGSQGRGIGSALLRPMLERCDAEGMPAYLEATSEQNRDLYLRHGFRVIAPLSLDPGPTMYRMWREPR